MAVTGDEGGAVVTPGEGPSDTGPAGAEGLGLGDVGPRPRDRATEVGVAVFGTLVVVVVWAAAELDSSSVTTSR